jgi:hypothetical protein
MILFYENTHLVAVLTRHLSLWPQSPALFWCDLCADFQSLVSPHAGTTTECLVVAPQTHACPSGAVRGHPVVTTLSLALCLGLHSHGSICHASEFNAGSAFGRGRYSVYGWQHPHWLAQIFSTEVRAHVMQPSPMWPSFMGLLHCAYLLAATRITPWHANWHNFIYIMCGTLLFWQAVTVTYMFH